MCHGNRARPEQGTWPHVTPGIRAFLHCPADAASGALWLYHLVHLVTYGRKHCILLEGRTARKVQRHNYMAVAGLLPASAGAKKSRGGWLMGPVCCDRNHSCVWMYESQLREIFSRLTPPHPPPCRRNETSLYLCWYPVTSTWRHWPCDQWRGCINYGP